jgi:hypothetical protein
LEVSRAREARTCRRKSGMGQCSQHLNN